MTLIGIALCGFLLLALVGTAAGRVILKAALVLGCLGICVLVAFTFYVDNQSAKFLAAGCDAMGNNCPQVAEAHPGIDCKEMQTRYDRADPETRENLKFMNEQTQPGRIHPFNCPLHD